MSAAKAVQDGWDLDSDEEDLLVDNDDDIFVTHDDDVDDDVDADVDADADVDGDAKDATEGDAWSFEDEDALEELTLTADDNDDTNEEEKEFLPNHHHKNDFDETVEEDDPLVDQLKGYLTSLDARVEATNVALDQLSGDEDATRELLDYYNSRPKLWDYTLDTELPRLDYCLVHATTGERISDKTRIRQLLLTIKYQEDAARSNNNNNNNDPTNNSRKEEKDKSHHHILVRAANQSLLADAIRVLSDETNTNNGPSSSLALVPLSYGASVVATTCALEWTNLLGHDDDDRGHDAPATLRIQSSLALRLLGSSQDVAMIHLTIVLQEITTTSITPSSPATTDFSIHYTITSVEPLWMKRCTLREVANALREHHHHHHHDEGNNVQTDRPGIRMSSSSDDNDVSREVSRDSFLSTWGGWSSQSTRTWLDQVDQVTNVKGKFQYMGTLLTLPTTETLLEAEAEQHQAAAAAAVMIPLQLFPRAPSSRSYSSRPTTPNKNHPPIVMGLFPRPDHPTTTAPSLFPRPPPPMVRPTPSEDATLGPPPPPAVVGLFPRPEQVSTHRPPPPIVHPPSAPPPPPSVGMFPRSEETSRPPPPPPPSQENRPRPILSGLLSRLAKSATAPEVPVHPHPYPYQRPSQPTPPPIISTLYRTTEPEPGPQLYHPTTQTPAAAPQPHPSKPFVTKPKPPPIPRPLPPPPPPPTKGEVEEEAEEDGWSDEELLLMEDDDDDIVPQPRIQWNKVDEEKDEMASFVYNPEDGIVPTRTRWMNPRGDRHFSIRAES
eukprot:scaffold344983_cov56-Attheya_sp.AAC.1